MKKKIIICIIMSIMSLSLISCGNKTQEVKQDTNAKNIEELEKMSDEQKLSYKDIGNNAVQKLGDVSDENKKKAKEEAIYNAIMDTEGKDILNSIDITDEEASLTLEKDTYPKISKVYLVSHKEDNGEEVTENYYVYEGDHTFEGMDMKTAFPKATKVESREATRDDNIEEAKRTLASKELVKVLSNKTEKVMSE